MENTTQRPIQMFYIRKHFFEIRITTLAQIGLLPLRLLFFPQVKLAPKATKFESVKVVKAQVIEVLNQMISSTAFNNEEFV